MLARWLEFRCFPGRKKDEKLRVVAAQETVVGPEARCWEKRVRRLWCAMFLVDAVIAHNILVICSFRQGAGAADADGGGPGPVGGGFSHGDDARGGGPGGRGHRPRPRAEVDDHLELAQHALVGL
jgi:hypothetical protein